MLLVLDDVEHAVEALAAHVADAGVLALERQQLRLGDGAQPLGALVELVAQHDVELLQGDRRGQRVAGIGAGPRQAGVAAHLLGDLRSRDGAADGEPRRQALAPRDDVGRHAIVLHRPHLAGASRRQLAFVEDEQRAPALGETASRGSHSWAARSCRRERGSSPP